MKKLLSILMALALVLSFAMTATAEEEVVLRFSGWGDANEKNVVQNILDTFTAETGIKTEYLYIPTDYLTKLTTMAASGELPDVGYLTEANVIQWGNEGMLMDLTAMYELPNYTEKMDTNKFYDKDGNLCGISMAVETYCLYFNPTYFDKMGIEYPPYSYEEAWTWEEFVDVCRQLTVDVNGKHPGEEGFDPANIRTYAFRMGKGLEMMEIFTRSNGGGIYSADFSELTLNTPENAEAIQRIADLMNVEHVMVTPESAANSMDMASSFLSESVAMVIDGQWSHMSMAVAAEEDGIVYDVAALPSMGIPTTGNTGGPCVVFKDTKHPEEAMLLCSYILDTEFVMSFITGGLWQPITTEWYTSEELQARWLTEGVHTAGYNDAIIKATLETMVPTGYFNVGCWQQLTDLIGPALDPVWTGTQTAEEALAGIADEAQKIWDDFAAKYAA